MILYVQGNLFHSPAQVLVNTVNTVGVMGKGIALQFRKFFPDMYEEYRILCEKGQFQIGMLWLYRSENKWVLNFPTKKHWRNPSKVEYIEAGLNKFVEVYADLGINSVAFPALGCGNGQLDFGSQVKPLMEKYLRNLPIDVFIYPDQGTSFIEHEKQKEMKQWLRSEPTALPFSEVWDDVVELLISQDEFETFTRKSTFKAQISENPRGIRIIAGNTNYYLTYETLTAFWQQLRTHGFSTRTTAPGLDRKISYLVPIFSNLDYVVPTAISDDYEGFENSVTTGLQILPSAFMRPSKKAKELSQLSFFG